ncbi:MAG TPA: hypothetical protein VIK18_09480 [Pirellulales bacterium]
MPACLRIARSSTPWAAGAARAYRTLPDDDDADDWEAVEPDPAELEQWDDPLPDDSLDDDFEHDDHDWDDADDWRDFDRDNDDNEDD